MNKPSIKGCPQGSVLVATLWNVLKNSLLTAHWPKNENIVVYDDDVTVTISGTSRRELEIMSGKCMTLLSHWVARNKLSLSEAKTKYVVFSNISLARNKIIQKSNPSIFWE